jgi:hypothetical protein
LNPERLFVPKDKLIRNGDLQGILVIQLPTADDAAQELLNMHDIL